MDSRKTWTSLVYIVFIAVILAITVLPAFAEDTGSWTTKSSMSTERLYYQLAAVGGKVYAIGGFNGNSLNSVEEYDSVTNTWSTKEPMLVSRYYHKAVLLEGKIYVMGGYNGIMCLNSLEVYDPATNTWTTKAPMNYARCYQETAVVDGKIYVIGGFNGTNRINSVEVYDPVANTWTTKAPMSTKRTDHQVEVIGGKIYTIGGIGSGFLSSVEVYDPAANAWTTKAPMSTARYCHQTAVVNDKIYAIGGISGWDELNTVEVYDPEANTWTTRASMSAERYYFDTAVADGKIYAVGGSSVGGYLSSVEAYDPAANSWTAKASMSSERFFHQVTVADGKMYALGGNSSGGYLDSLEVYTEPPLAPINLNVTSGAEENFLSWTSSMNTNSYTVKRAVTSGGPYTVIADNITEAAYTDTTVTVGTIYYYVITAVNSLGESTNSNEAYTEPPLAPTDLAVTAGNMQTNLTWIASLNTGSYIIKRAATAGGQYTVIADNITETYYTDTSVTNGTIYYYIVTAVNCSGESSNSNEVYTETPAAPTNLAAAEGDMEVGLSWTASLITVSYTVKRAEMGGGPYTVIADNITETYYTDTTVTNGTTYYYVVTAVNYSGESQISNEVYAIPEGQQ